LGCTLLQYKLKWFHNANTRADTLFHHKTNIYAVSGHRRHPIDWLPELDDFQGMKLENGGSVSNNEFSNRFSSPTEIIILLNDQGRTTGHYLQFSHKDGCNLKSGLYGIETHTHLYNDITGAEKAFGWFKSESGVTQVDFRKWDVDHFYFLANFEGPCGPSAPLRYINLTFRRFNVVSTVFILSFEGTLSDDEMLDLALKYVDEIDVRIVAASK
jgi:hypothetical protein